MINVDSPSEPKAGDPAPSATRHPRASGDLPQPPDAVQLADILDRNAVQSLMDDFYRLTNIGVAVLDIQGNVLVATGWQDICTQFHRRHPEASQYCLQSDTVLSRGVPAGTFRRYRCQNSMWDIATPIVVDDRHVGNLFLGQFFFDDEEIDYEVFRRQAKEYGFDEAAYRAALERVPRWSREKVETAMTFYARLAGLIADMGHSNLQLARAIAERDSLLQQQGESTQLFSAVLEHTPMMAVYLDVHFNFIWVNRAYADTCQYAPSYFPGKNLFDLYPHAENQAIFQRVVDTGEPFFVAAKPFEFPDQPERGVTYWDWSLIPVKDAQDRVIGLVFTLAEVTDRIRAEAGQRASEERFRTLFTTMSQGIVYQDANGAIVMANPAAERILGLTGEQVHSRTSADARWRAVREDGSPFPGEEHPSMVALRTGRPVTGVVMGIHNPADNDTRWLLVDAVPEWQSGGAAPHRVFTVFADITERQSAEDRLRTLGKMLDVAPASITVYDLDGNLLYANRETFAIHQYDEREFMALNLHQIDVPASEAQIKARMELIAREGSARFEVGHYRRDRSVVPLEVYVQLVRWLGQPAFLSIATDITERKQAEAALRDSEERFRSIAEQMTDMVFITDRQGVITYASPACRQIFACAATDMVGQHFARFLAEGELEKASGRFLHTVETGSPGSAVLRMRRADGTLFTGELNATRSHLGGETGTLGIIRDISERLAAEEQLRQAQKMEAVGRLAGGVAHDFNNMLTAILGYAEIALQQTRPESDIHHGLQEIQRAGQRSADLTRQLLAFARRQTISPRVLDLNDTVSGTLKMLRRLIGEDIELLWLPGHDLWPVKIDPSQIDQVLANLAVNARDAIAGIGLLTIETNNVVLDEAAGRSDQNAGCAPGRYVMLAVSDTGSGMDSDTLAHIFEPFFTTKGVGEGTGLGLATVYGIVKQNDGCINVYSESGRGTTFKVYLPACQVSGPAATGVSESTSLPGGSETVLLVEDERMLLELGKAILDRLGYTVLAAEGPEAALRLAAEYGSDIHVLMTDVVMPEMNGRDLAERVRALRPAIRCLYTSGYTANVIAHRGVVDEKVMFIQKPFSVQALAGKLREALGE